MLPENEIISKVLLTIDQYKGKVSSLKSGIANDDYSPRKCRNYSRLLVWKVCLLTDTLNISKWDEALNGSRVVYSQLKSRADLRVPWDKLEKDNVFYRNREDSSNKKSTASAASVPSVTPSAARNGQVSPLLGNGNRSFKNIIERTSIEHDPLGLNSSARHQSRSPSLSTRSPSPVPTSYDHTAEDIDLLFQITLDIERIFPGNEFFHSTSQPSSTSSSTSQSTATATTAFIHRRTLVQILYIWSKCNPSIGYKQGLHELLGLIYLNFAKESIQIPNTNTINVDDLKILKLYNIKYLAHDTFSIFNKFINQSGVASKYYEDEAKLFSSIQSFNVNLLKVDQLIHYNLTNKLKLESQLWLIRYFRLLLSRELGNDLNIVMTLWEKIIASPTVALTGIPDMLAFTVITLLIHIKTELITSDFSEALSLLLHYPVGSILKKYNNSNEFAHGVYKDAVSLYERKDNDLKLYEYGIKINENYNPNLKIRMSYNGGPNDSNKSADNSARSSQERTHTPVNSHQSKEEKLKFEKLRLEMRLKKKAQAMVKK